jgi:hypothetical protein
MVRELLDYSTALQFRDPGMGETITKSSSGYAWFLFMPLPSGKLEAWHKNK